MKKFKILFLIGFFSLPFDYFFLTKDSQKNEKEYIILFSFFVLSLIWGLYENRKNSNNILFYNIITILFMYLSMISWMEHGEMNDIFLLFSMIIFGGFFMKIYGILPNLILSFLMVGVFIDYRSIFYSVGNAITIIIWSLFIIFHIIKEIKKGRKIPKAWRGL